MLTCATCAAACGLTQGLPASKAPLVRTAEACGTLVPLLGPGSGTAQHESIKQAADWTKKQSIQERGQMWCGFAAEGLACTPCPPNHRQCSTIDTTLYCRAALPSIEAACVVLLPSTDVARPAPYTSAAETVKTNLKDTPAAPLAVLRYV